MREAYAANVVTYIVDSALMGCHTSLKGTQSRMPGTSEGAPTASQVAPFPTQLVETQVVDRAMIVWPCVPYSCAEPRACGSRRRADEESSVAYTGTVLETLCGWKRCVGFTNKKVLVYPDQLM